MVGKVVRIIRPKGFGWIQVEGESEARFFSANDVQPYSLFETVQEGDDVEFTPTDIGKGPRAVEVKQC